MLLVAGAPGGVGSLAVQLAARAGARIVAPALPEDEEFLRELGCRRSSPRKVRSFHSSVDTKVDVLSIETFVYPEGQDGPSPTELTDGEV